MNVEKIAEASPISSVIDASKTQITQKLKNRKKKALKKAAKLRSLSLAEQISLHLEEHGWAVVDNVFPLDLIRRVRIEINLFKEHYEQSEIWVGRRSDVGANVHVPSVRGDRVLWMCGGHKSAVEEAGITRTVEAYGEIEPCRLEIKAVARIQKFLGMK
jgi:hypothetical protein